jgi:hypothetical protein
MKNVIFVAGLLLCVPAIAVDNHAAADAAKAEHPIKRVCVDQMKDGRPVRDAKGNTKQTCKDVKEHKKLEVTK